MDVAIMTANEIAKMREHLSLGQKIKAIKLFRNSAQQHMEPTISLRVAKHSVENYWYNVLGKPLPPGTPAGSMQFESALQILAGPLIKEIIVDFGNGPCTVDVEAMELKALTQLESIGLEACGRILELCHVIQAFADGKRIGVLEES